MKQLDRSSDDLTVKEQGIAKRTKIAPKNQKGLHDTKWKGVQENDKEDFCGESG